MHMLIVSEQFAFGGLETQIIGQVNFLQNTGHKVFIATGNNFSKDYLSLFDGHLCNLPLMTGGGYDDLFDAVDMINNFARDNAIEVIHAHPFMSLLPSLFASCQLRLPLLITLHGPAVLRSVYGPVFDKLLRALILPEAAHVYCVSPEIKALAEPYAGASCTFLPNAVDLKLFQPVDRNSSSKWALVGRIDDTKAAGMKDFLCKAKEIGLPGVDIFGEGTARTDLERFVQEKGFTEVCFKGYSSKLHLELKNGYAGVAGMGRVVLEGVAMDLPVILVGYDGTKGIMDADGLTKASWWNYSGRGLKIISAEEMAGQISQLEHANKLNHLRSWIEANANEAVVWNRYLDSLKQLKYEYSPLTDKVWGLLQANLGKRVSYFYDEELLSDLNDLIGKECPERMGFGQGRVELYKVNKLNRQQNIQSLLEQIVNEKKDTITRKEEQISYLQKQLYATREDLCQKEIVLEDTLNQKKDIEKQLYLSQQALAEKVVEEESIVTLKKEISLLQSQLNLTRELLSQRDLEVNTIYVSKRYRAANKLAVALWYIKHPGFVAAKIKINARQLLRRKLAPSTKQWIKKFILRQTLPTWQAPDPLSAPAEEITAILPTGVRLPTKYDILVFSVIDWDFRFQRPQQMSRILANQGHRIFYLSIRFNLQSDSLVLKRIMDNIYELQLPGPADLNVYSNNIPVTVLEAFYRAMVQLKYDYKIADAVCLTQLPFWAPLVLKLHDNFGWKIIYDCMDRHSGFSTNKTTMLSEEERLARASDLVVVTAVSLFEEQKKFNSNCVIIPNAVDFDHFNSHLDQQPQILNGLLRPIIGYYGAISDWFDVGLVEYLARQCPEWSFVLIGSTYGADVRRINSLGNIHMLGEIPYKQLPEYLHCFDICMIPFELNPLTEATNPVKFYEYLSAGKPVVSVPLPELMSFPEYLVHIAGDPQGFLEAIKRALQGNNSWLVQKRIEFARNNTWHARILALEQSIEKTYELVSIIILTYNNLHLTKQCIDSIFKNTSYPNFELIIVDNASKDGTVDYLKELSIAKSNVMILLNDENEGFAKGNNQGIRASSGEYIILLNNDTIVTPAWLTKLVNYLKQDQTIGMVGPVTNCIGNEAMIPTNYSTTEEMLEFAEQYTEEHDKDFFEINVLAMFCIAVRKEIFNLIGFLDEQFQIGMFEDDDFALRVKEKGYKLICAEDIFLHHFNNSGFKLFSEEKYKEIFETNRKKFEDKWGITWEPHQYRPANNHKALQKDN